MNKQENEPLFRLGGVYRTRDGQVTAVFRGPHQFDPGIVLFESETDPRMPRWVNGMVWRSLRISDGDFLPVEVSMTPTLDKPEAEKSHPDEMTLDELMTDLLDPNAAMIARDGPIEPKYILFTCVDCTGCEKCAPVSTAKPCPAGFLSMRSPDSCASLREPLTRNFSAG
jgi:hypothetical protein